MGDAASGDGQHRGSVIGLETEYAIIFTPEPGSPRRPDGITLFSAISAAVLTRVRGLPARHRKAGHFLENGAFLHYEGRPDLHAQGLLEYSTPECSSPREAALYARAGAQLLAEALPDAERTLAAAGHRGSITLGRNAQDAHGNVYGSHENYQVSDPLPVGRRILLHVLRALLLAVAIPFLVVAIGTVLLSVVAYYAAYTAILGVGLMAILLVQAAPPLHGRAGRVSLRLDRALERFEALVRDPLWRGYGLYFHYLFLPLARLLSGLLRLFMFRRIRVHLPTFLATRPIFAGTGHVDRTGPGPIFRLSEKAASIGSIARLYWDDRRPMIDLKNFVFEWSSMTAARKRLHIMLSDSNMNEVSEFLKVGTTSLVLRAIAASALPPTLRLRDPVAALHAISADPTLRQTVPLVDGRWLTALQVQWEIWTCCDAFVRAAPAVSLADAEVLREWRQVLWDLERHPAATADRVDWVLKRRLIDEALAGEITLEELAPWREATLAAERAGIELQGDGRDLDRLRALLPTARYERMMSSLDAHHLESCHLARHAELLYRAKKVDLKYHDVAAGRGYFHRCQEAGMARHLSTPAQLEGAMRTPPSAPAAQARGEFVRRHHRDPRGRVNWKRGRAGNERQKFGRG